MNALVIDKNKTPGAPCCEARARRMLDSGKAAVFRMMPFTIILKHSFKEKVKKQKLKVDPGSHGTGVCITSDNKNTGNTVVYAANIKHRGEEIKLCLIKRRAARQSRRSRNTRYRKPGNLKNQSAKKSGTGWLPPSLMHRIRTTLTVIKKLMKFCAIDSISVEINKFDPQKMENPEISGIEYQQGTLQGYEVREYLLEKWTRKCAYCGAEDVPLQIEHIVPRSRGGSGRVTNLTLACVPCNKTKDNQTAEEFGHPDIQKQAKASLKDAAYMNAIRFRLKAELEKLGLPVSDETGSRTKMNRINQGYPKDHWIDAACLGEDGAKIAIKSWQFLRIISEGHGTRQVQNMNEFGFPKGKPKKGINLKYFGFQTGDYVEAIVPKGMKKGRYKGKVSCRSTGRFNIKLADDKIQGISYEHMRILQKKDGYNYSIAYSSK